MLANRYPNDDLENVALNSNLKDIILKVVFSSNGVVRHELTLSVLLCFITKIYVTLSLYGGLGENINY